MIEFANVPIYLHRDYVDFRKQINGLSMIITEQMCLDIFSQSLFVFCNKRRDKLKVLYWDQTGFCLWHKRLEQDKFKWPRKNDRAIIGWDKEQFEWLLRGFDVTHIRPHKVLKYSQI